MVNILIRTSNRPNQFQRCIDSIRSQTYRDLKLIISVDTPQATVYTLDILERTYLKHEIIQVRPNKKEEYFYNLYCNELLKRVESGWYFFLDDDDVINKPDAIEIAMKYTNPDHRPIICQMLRGNKLKPSNDQIELRKIERGKIGMPCIFAHSSMRPMNFIADVGADYFWIKQFQHKARFIKHVLVNCSKRGWGK